MNFLICFYTGKCGHEDCMGEPWFPLHFTTNERSELLMPLIIFLLITAGQFSCSWRQVCALGDNKDAQMSPLLFRRGATAGIFTLLELPSSIILRESPYAHDSVSPACNQTHSQKLSNASWGCCSLFSRLLDSKIVNHLTTFKLHSQTRVFSANIFSSVVLN